MSTNKEIITDNFCFKVYDVLNSEHLNIKDILKKFKDASEICFNLDDFIANNLIRNKDDGISNTYVIYYMNNPIGILFTNFHPAEEIDGKMLPDEIEICLGIIPRYQNKHLGQTLEREISIKLLEMYPTISFIVASIKDENIRSKKAILNAGYTYFEGNQYHFNRR